MRAVFGRVETIEVAGKPVSILLIKNPAGANEVLRTLSLERADGPLDLWIALNDGIADGRDVSWVWDADFELLADGVRRVVCAGTRAPEMALRLKYAGWPTDSISVAEPIADSLDRALVEARGRLFALPTYTALLELRTLLADRGLAGEYWE
jgi:UDP-N-acetylmuramyl tripeptide synthase